MTKVSRRTAAAAVAVLLITAAGCSEETPDETGATPEPVPVTAGDATAQLERYLLERDRALESRTVDYDRLRPVATGDMFIWVQEQVVGMLEGDVVQTGEYVHTLGKPSTREDGLVVVDCEDRTDVTFTAGGEVRDPDYVDPEGEPLRNPVPVEYVLVETGDSGSEVWKVSNTRVLWDQSC